MDRKQPAPRTPETVDPGWNGQPLAAVLELAARDHRRLRAELDAALALARRLDLSPGGVAEQLAVLHEAVCTHHEKEERILFPLILAGLGAQLAAPVGTLEREHADHAEGFRRLRDRSVPVSGGRAAAARWRELAERLTHLENGLRDHCRLEDHVLFRRALCE